MKKAFRILKVLILPAVAVWLVAGCGGIAPTPTPVPTGIPPTAIPPTETGAPPPTEEVKPTVTTAITPTARTIVSRTPTALPSSTATTAPTVTMLPTAPPLPANFVVTLAFGPDDICGYDDFVFDYDITLGTDTITMVQVVNGLTSGGPYIAATGVFTSTVSGLPGAEIFTGTISTAPDAATGGTAVLIDGRYTYTDDPGVSCEGLWPFSGTVIVP